MTSLFFFAKVEILVGCGGFAQRKGWCLKGGLCGGVGE